MKRKANSLRDDDPLLEIAYRKAMSEVLFYHLTESKLEDALPPLLDKSLERGWRVVVQAGDAERRMRWMRICGPFARTAFCRMARMSRILPPTSRCF